MRVFYDLDSETLSSTLGLSNPITELLFKRGLEATLEVQFTRGAAVQELDPAATGIFGMKVIGKYDGNYVVAALAWVKTGTGVDTVYTFTFSFINTDLDALFHVDADVTNDVVTVSLMGEVQWILGGARHKSQTITVKIVNDVNRGGESVPNMPPIAYGVFLPSITRLVGGTATDLDALPTVGLDLGYIILLLVTVGGELAWVPLVLTEGSAITGGDVQPLDHDPVTNDKYWRGATVGSLGAFDGSYASLSDIPATFAPSAHTHPQSEVTDLVDDLADKQPLNSGLTSISGPGG